MLAVFDIIGWFLAVFVFLESFEFSLQVIFSNFIFGVECEPPLPLNHVQDGEENSEDDHTSQVHRKSVKHTEDSAVDIVLVSRLAKSQHENEIGAICTKPEEEEVRAVSFVLYLGFLLHVLFVRECLRSSTCCRSITPWNIMQVTHRIDAENVWEHRDQDQVRKQSNHIAFEVLEKVNWPQKEGDCVNCKHNNSCKDKPGEVVVAHCSPNVSVWVENLMFWVKASSCQVANHAQNSSKSNKAEEGCCYNKAWFCAVKR